MYGKELQDLTYRFTMRAAKHLGKSSDDRWKIYDCLTDAYKIRSNIVHGSINNLEESKHLKKSKYWSSPTEMLQELSGWLRQALQLFLMDRELRSLLTVNNPKKHFWAKLDESIARGEDFSVAEGETEI